MRKKYRIGEFAKNLGVTPGFLKHHENYGLLRPSVAESGYRYYEFPQSMLAFQCIRLQSIGFTSKEVSGILLHSADIDIPGLILEKKEELRDRIHFYEETLSYLDELAAEPGAPNEAWSVREAKPFYYLENASEGEFLDNRTIAGSIRHWNQYMPLVSICSRYQLCAAEPALLSLGSWSMGLTIEQKRAERLHFAPGQEAKLISPGLCFIYETEHVRRRNAHNREEALRQTLEKPLSLCRKHHFSLAGDIYNILFFSSTAREENWVKERILFPIKPM